MKLCKSACTIVERGTDITVRSFFDVTISDSRLLGSGCVFSNLNNVVKI